MQPDHDNLTGLRRAAAAVLIAAATLTFPLAAGAAPLRSLTVTGEGGAVLVPDRATITLGVTHDAPLAGDALRGMSGAMTAVLARLAAAGIAETDVQTGQLSLGPRWEYNPVTGEQAMAGFTATTIVTVLVRDLNDLGTVLDAAVQDGANRLDGLGFSSSNDRAARDEARRAAVADARARAELYADAAGVELGDVITISEQVNADGPMPQLRMAIEAAPSVPVAEGEINLIAQVTIVYEIDD